MEGQGLIVFREVEPLGEAHRQDFDLQQLGATEVEDQVGLDFVAGQDVVPRRNTGVQARGLGEIEARRQMERPDERGIVHSTEADDQGSRRDDGQATAGAGQAGRQIVPGQDRQQDERE